MYERFLDTEEAQEFQKLTQKVVGPDLIIDDNFMKDFWALVEKLEDEKGDRIISDAEKIYCLDETARTRGYIFSESLKKYVRNLQS